MTNCYRFILYTISFLLPYLISDRKSNQLRITLHSFTSRITLGCIVIQPSFMMEIPGLIFILGCVFVKRRKKYKMNQFLALKCFSVKNMNCSCFYRHINSPYS